MSDFIRTRCRRCDRQIRLKLRAGMSYLPLEDVLRYARGNARRTLQDIVANHRVVSAEHSHRLFACTRCDTLHKRFYVRVDYDAGKMYGGEVFETTFRCGKCRTPLAEPGKPLNEYRCSQCGHYALDDGVRSDPA